MPKPLRCDFCSLADPGWEFPTETFDLGWKTLEGDWNRSAGSWLACDRCRKSVTDGKRELLVRRGIYAVTRELGPAEALEVEEALVDMMRELHGDFWAHRQGPAIPLTPERRAEYEAMPAQAREADAPFPEKIAAWAQRWGVGL